MKILGIDSSGMVAGVAIVEDDILIAEYTMNHKRTHSETLLPMIDEILKRSETELDTLDAIAVAAGPGSFTGLRIGAATAKGLAMSIDRPIIPVKSCEGLAYNAYGFSGIVCPMLDARRNQVYAGLYRVQGGIEVIMEQTPIAVEELLERINELSEDVIYLGDGASQYEEIIWRETRVPCRMAPASMNRQRAASVAALGEILYKERCFVTADDFAPQYLRQSQAERVRQERG